MDIMADSISFYIDTVWHAIGDIDIDYWKWVFWVIYPIVISFVLPAFLLLFIYASALFLYFYRHRHRLRDAYAKDFWNGAIKTIAAFWDAHGSMWHGFEVHGYENIPLEGPALLIYYHGVIPIDIYYVVSRTVLEKGRAIRPVGDRFLFRIPGWRLLMEVFKVTPGTIQSCVDILKDGHILAIAPGGVREALFGNEYYPVMWGKRVGFAKVALQSNAPVIPMFTQNVREAFRVPNIGRSLLRKLYECTRLPIVPIYGGFPVKLRTYFGKPIYPDSKISPEEFARKVASLCHSVRCGAGRHCELKGNTPICVCKKHCSNRFRPTCGTDGRTYTNRCELKRASCIRNTHIRMRHRGRCREIPRKADNPDVEKKSVIKDIVERLPLVCYQVERDELRQLLIDWVNTQVTAMEYNSGGRTYNMIVRDTFIECDKFPHDNRLSSDELLRCFEKNETEPGHEETDAHVLRGLCIDALINLADVDDDWLLDLREFARLMERTYTPAEQDCQLEDVKYRDGAETKVGCNTCICACGNWVCTSGVCEKTGNEKPGPVRYGTIPPRDLRKRLISGFRASDTVSFDQIEREIARSYAEEDDRRSARKLVEELEAQNLSRKPRTESGTNPQESPCIYSIDLGITCTKRLSCSGHNSQVGIFVHVYNSEMICNDTNSKMSITEEYMRNIDSVEVGDSTIGASDSVRNLGAFFDSNMFMDKHVTNMCNKAFRGLHEIKQIRQFLTKDATKSLVHAFVTSHLDYCNALLFNLPQYQYSRLQKVLNASAKMVCRVSRSQHITPVLMDLQ